MIGFPRRNPGFRVRRSLRPRLARVRPGFHFDFTFTIPQTWQVLLPRNDTGVSLALSLRVLCSSPNPKSLIADLASGQYQTSKVERCVQNFGDPRFPARGTSTSAPASVPRSRPRRRGRSSCRRTMPASSRPCRGSTAPGISQCGALPEGMPRFPRLVVAVGFR